MPQNCLTRCSCDWAGIVNHLTMMVPGTKDRFLVFAFGLMWNEVTASNLLVVDTVRFAASLCQI